MNIIEQLVEEKIARNAYHAAAIANGLHLAELPNDSERLARARVYRAWRDAGEPAVVAFANAITGRQPLELPLATGSVMASERAEAQQNREANGQKGCEPRSA
jgi:hypothetical protein